MAEWWYNTTYHTTTKMSPFEAVYDSMAFNPPTLLSYVPGTNTNESTDQFLRDRDQVIQPLKHNLSEAQNRMKHYVDKRKTEREFEIADWVYLKLKPYR